VQAINDGATSNRATTVTAVYNSASYSATITVLGIGTVPSCTCNPSSLCKGVTQSTSPAPCIPVACVGTKVCSIGTGWKEIAPNF
jgi:hypothetical protein